MTRREFDGLEYMSDLLEVAYNYDLYDITDELISADQLIERIKEIAWELGDGRSLSSFVKLIEGICPGYDYYNADDFSSIDNGYDFENYRRRVLDEIMANGGFDEDEEDEDVELLPLTRESDEPKYDAPFTPIVLFAENIEQLAEVGA